MRKRIITLLTVLLLSTTGFSAPFALPVYADEADDAGSSFNGEPDDDPVEGDNAYIEDDGEFTEPDIKDDPSIVNNPVKIGYNTRLSTTDANVVSKYQTMLNFAFRTTDDRYYTNDVFSVYSAAQWWLKHNNSNVVYAGDVAGVASYFEKHLYNVRSLFGKNGKFFSKYTGQKDTILVNSDDTSNLKSGFTIESDYAELIDKELDWRWFVNWKDPDEIYRENGKAPNYKGKKYIPISQITPCESHITDSENNNVTLYGSVSTYKDYYNYILAKIKSRQDYKNGLDIVQSPDTIKLAKTSAEDILRAYNYVAVIKFLQDSTEYFSKLNNATNVYQATAIDWGSIESAFDGATGKVKITKEISTETFLLGKSNASCNRYILFTNNGRKVEKPNNEDANNSSVFSNYIADSNASGDGYYLYIYMKSGVARNTTECANMFKADLSEETATKWWKGLDDNDRKEYSKHIVKSKIDKKHYYNIYDLYCREKAKLTEGAFVSRGKCADDEKYGLNNTSNEVLRGFYVNSEAFWDGDTRKPMYAFPTTTRNLTKSYRSAYSKYVVKDTASISTKPFTDTSTDGNPVVYTDTSGITGDFAVQLYTVGDPFTDAGSFYKNANIQPVDNYARAKTWKEALKYISTNENKTAKNVKGQYVLRTGLAVAVKSVEAPEYSTSNSNVEQKYTFDKVTYQKYDKNMEGYIEDEESSSTTVSKPTSKLNDLIKFSSNGRSYIDTKVTYPMTTINKMLPLTPRTGNTASVRSNNRDANADLSSRIAYAWCGRLTNLSKAIGEKTYKKNATVNGFNYAETQYRHKFSTDFKRYSVLYRVYNGGEVSFSEDRGDANCAYHYPTKACNQHEDGCKVSRYSNQHANGCPLHLNSDNLDSSGIHHNSGALAQNVYCTCNRKCTCEDKAPEYRSNHKKNCAYYRQNLANAQYRNYFSSTATYANKNLDLLYKSIAACNTSPILSAGYKQITLKLYKNDGTTKEVTLYLGKYDDIYDRAYISQYWQTTRSNTDGGPGEVQDVIHRLYGDNWEGEDSVFDTTKVQNDPYKKSQAMYPEANTYHWETAPVDMYMQHDNNYVYRSYSKLAGNKSLSENYYDSLVFAFDWYRAMPVSEVTVWYKPATYKVAYHSNVPTPSGTTSDTKVYLKADTSLSSGTEASPHLVYYDDYSLSAPKDAFGTDRWNQMEEKAAVAGYTFDHWNICLDGDTNAISAASNNANASTWYSSGNIISINPQGAASNMQFNINSEQTRYPFMYNNVMDNSKNSSHTINVYAVWKKSEYAVYYTSNQGAASKIFPDPSIIKDEAKSSTSEYKDGYVHGNSSTNSKSKVLATETINSKIADPSNQFLRPGYFVIGYSLFDTGAPNDTCGTEYYNGASHDSSAAWANHAGLVNNAGNIADGSGKLYSADSYGSDNLTAAYKRNTTNFSPYNHLTTYGNLLVSNPDKLNVRSFGEVGPIDFTKSPFNNAANNMGYYSNYIVTLRSSNAYGKWQQAVVDLQNAQTDPRYSVYSSDTMRGMMKQALKSLDAGLISVTKDNDDLYRLLCYKNATDIQEFHPYSDLSAPGCEDLVAYITEYNNIIKDTKDIHWMSYKDIRNIILKYADRLNYRNPDCIELDRDLDDVINHYNRCKNSMYELSHVTNRMVSLRDELEGYKPPKKHITEELTNALRKRIKDYLDEYNFNSDSDPAAAYTALSNFDCEEAANNVRDINRNALGYLEDYVRAEYNEAFQVTPAAVFYAHWEPDRFYVRYNQNDANVASSRNPDGVQLSGNSKVEADPQPTYPGHTSLLLYPGQFSNKSVYYGDPTVTYASNQWQRINAYNSIDKTEQSDYLGWSDVVTTDGAGAYTAKFGDGTNFNYGEMLKTVFNSADGSPQVDDLTDKYYNYIYNLYAIFDDWPIMYIQEQAEKSGYSMLYDTASGLLTGASGVTSNLLDAHTKTEIETHLLSSDANGNYRLPIIAYDREDSASNSSAVTNNNTWNKIAGPQVIQNRPDCTEVNRPTGVVTWIGANGYADPTAFPASLGYVNGSSNQGNMSNIAQIYIDPTGSNRKADGSVGVRNTYYHLRFFDPSYILNKVDNTQETKFELRYFIKDSRGKGYERQANFYVGANAKINIMDNP